MPIDEFDPQPLRRAFPQFALLLGLLGLITGCSSPPPPVAEERPNYFWIGDDVEGSPRMIISLSQQRIYYFKGSQLVGASPISSGREHGWTKTGSFKIIQKNLHHRSNLYGSFVTADGAVVDNDVDARKDKPPPGTRFLGADMKYFMRITGAIGMHRGYLPGYPASHGCIRLPGNMAEKFFYATPLGTPIEIRQGPVDIDESAVVVQRQQEPKPQALEAKLPPARRKAANQPRTPPPSYFRRPPRPRPLPRGTTLYL